MLLVALVAFTGIAYNLMKPAQTAAATNNVINFQARLETDAGAIVPDGNYNVEFKLYSASSGGSALWTEDYLNSASQGVTVANGYLTANLGSVTAFPSTINWDQQLWLTMNIGGTSTGSVTWDGEMSPRLQLTALPYAFRAGKLADPAGSGSLLGWNTQTSAHNLYLPNEGGTLCVENSANCGFLTGSASDYIQNGTSPQTANFNVTGTGVIGTSLTTPSVTSTGALSIQAGGTNNSLTLDSSGTGSINIGTAATNKTIYIGNNTATGATQTIDIGYIASPGSLNTILTNINIGTASNSNATTTIQAGTANGSIQIGSLNSGATQNINIGTNTTAVQTVKIGSTYSTSPTTIQGGTSGISLKSTGNITVGTSDTTGTLFVLDTKTSSGDPTGVNGGMYYNSNLGEFRCYQAGAWTNCGGSGTATTLQSAYDAGNTINLDNGPVSITATGSGSEGIALNVASGNSPFLDWNNGTSAFGIRSDDTDLLIGPWDSASENTHYATLSINTNGDVLLQGVNDSATALQVKNVDNDTILGVDTTGNGAVNISGVNGWITTIDENSLNFSRGSANYIQASDPDGELYFGAGGASDNLVLASDGRATFKPTLDSDAAFQIQKAGTGGTLFNVDTSGNSIDIGATGTSTNASTVHIADQTNGSGDQIVSIGSTNGSSTTLIQGGSPGSGSAISLVAGTGSIDIGTNSTAHTVEVNNQTGASQTVINSGTGGILLSPSGTSNTGVTVQPATDSTSAFQIQNANGDSLLNADTSGSQVNVDGGLTVSYGSSGAFGGANGGYGTGASGDTGGGGGGAIGGGIPTEGGQAGDTGGQAMDISGLFSVVSGLGYSTTGPGAGGGSGSGYCTKSGYSATGFGSGGGAAGWYGGNGGNGLYGGGGAGAAGGTCPSEVGGTGGQGVVVISPNSGTNVVKTSGTTYTVPAGVTSLKIWAIGGGGGGAGSTNVDGGSGGGGGAGGVAYRTVAVTPGQVITYSLGSSGTPGTDAVNGNAGGATTVTAGSITITGNGGAGGRYQNTGTNAGGTYVTGSAYVPFHVQDANGVDLLSADITNLQVNVAGNLNSTTYSVNGTPGANITCGSGTSLQGATVVSGIITGGSCMGASYASVYLTSAQTTANVTVTTLNFTGERADTDNYHSTTTNTSRLVAPTSGFYHITGDSQWAANTTGNRYLDILLNGSSTIAYDRRPASGYAGEGTISVDWYMNAGDYVELRAYQESGGNLNINAQFSIFKVSSANSGGAGSSIAIGTLDAQTKSADGAVISDGNLYLQTADASDPGLVSTGTQTFAGDKTFNGYITGNTGLSVSGSGGVSLNGTGSGGTTIGNTTSGSAVNLATSGSNSITLTAGGSSNTGTTVKTVNNSTAAFQVQNASGSGILNVDTSNNAVTITGSAPSGSQTFSYTGGSQTFTVPAGVTSINVTLYGAQGGTGYNGGAGGAGGETTGTISVTPGEVLTIITGGQGGNASGLTGGAAGYGGGGTGGTGTSSYAGAGGGGGMSAIETSGGTYLAIAAGGGGGFGNYTGNTGGVGGGLTGGVSPTGRKGGGGTQSAGGAAGGTYCPSGYYATAGSQYQGGNGGNYYIAGGGGGGGYYGGGGGDCGTASGGGAGGGGSALVPSGGSTSSGVQSGNGQVAFSWGSAAGPALQVQDTNGDTYFSVNSSTGSTLVQSDSATSFQVQNADGDTILGVDTTPQSDSAGNSFLGAVNTAGYIINTATDTPFTFNNYDNTHGYQFEQYGGGGNDMLAWITAWNSGFNSTLQVSSNSNSSAYPTLKVNGYTGQTTSLIEVTTAANGDVLNVDSNGNLTLNNPDNTLHQVLIEDNDSGGQWRFGDTTGSGDYPDGLQGGYSEETNLYSYWGLVLSGNRQTVAAPSFYDDHTHDADVTILGSGNATNSLQVLNDSGTSLFNINNDLNVVQIQGTGSNHGAGRLTFGDYVGDEDQTVFVGEYGTTDTDQLQLNGESGIILTAGSYTSPLEVAQFYVDSNFDHMLLGENTSSTGSGIDLFYGSSSSPNWEIGTDSDQTCDLGGGSKNLYFYTTAGGCALQFNYSGGATFYASDQTNAFQIWNDDGDSEFNVNTNSDTIQLFSGVSGGSFITDLGSASGNHGVCHSGSGSTLENVRLIDCSNTAGADYAETYPVASGVDYGDIVATGTNMVNTYGTDSNGDVDWTKILGQVTQMVKTTTPYQTNTIGIVSNNHGEFSSVGYNLKSQDNPMPIALNGRVPVNMAPDSAAIEPGDYVTTSGTYAGKATKATQAGFVIGKALEAWNPASGKTQVMVYVEQGYWPGPSQTSYLQNGGDASLGNLTVNGLSTVNDVQASGTVTADSIVASTATVQNMTSTNSTTDSLSVGGNANVGNLVANGTITTNDLTVNGSTTVGGLTATSISAISASIGDITVSGAVTTGDLTVTGSATLATLHVTGDTTISGDLTIGGHLVTSGQAPTTQVESAAGDDATCTIDGNDTGGKITIKTGDTNLADGAQCTLTFHTAFSKATNPVISPRNKDSAQVQSFVDSAASKLVVEFAQTPAAGKTYVFNYFNTQ